MRELGPGNGRAIPRALARAAGSRGSATRHAHMCLDFVVMLALAPGLQHLADNLRHVCGRKGSQGLRANVTHRTETQTRRHSRRFIRCLDNRDDAILSLCPVQLLHGRSERLRHLLKLPPPASGSPWRYGFLAQ